MNRVPQPLVVSSPDQWVYCAAPQVEEPSHTKSVVPDIQSRAAAIVERPQWSKQFDEPIPTDPETPLNLSLGPNTNRISEPPVFPNPAERNLQRLVSRATQKEEFPFLLETVVSGMKVAGIVESLQGRDAQTFIDVVDEVRVTPLHLRARCSLLIHPLSGTAKL